MLYLARWGQTLATTTRQTLVTSAEEATTMTIDMRAKKILGHQRNIQRYCRLLATHLTDLERQYLHKRIGEENAALDRLSMQMNEPPTLTNERLHNPAIGSNPPAPPDTPGSSS
jgi:beta-xylosidase